MEAAAKTVKVEDDSKYFVENGKLHDIGAGDALAVIINMPETPPEAWAAGWNAARIHAERILAFRTEQRDKQMDYACDLQRIIEDLCSDNAVRTPETAARYHYNMAVAYRAKASTP